MSSDYLDDHAEISMHGSKLPHWQQDKVMQFITFRLGDALPREKLEAWKEEKAIWKEIYPEPWSVSEQAEYRQRFATRLQDCLDEGAGCCLFKESVNREILKNVLMYDHDKRAQFYSWIIMPNHVHLLFKPLAPIAVLLKCWKGVSARRIGCGSIWQKDYRDTMIRNDEHFARVVRYIRRNPADLKQGTFTLWESERARAVQ